MKAPLRAAAWLLRGAFPRPQSSFPIQKNIDNDERQWYNYNYEYSAEYL